VHVLVITTFLGMIGWHPYWWGLDFYAPLVLTFMISLVAAMTLRELVELPLQRRLRNSSVGSRRTQAGRTQNNPGWTEGTISGAGEVPP
jgi:peptidoglycan/LPS O-acetylase OafA/YrhL